MPKRKRDELDNNTYTDLMKAAEQGDADAVAEFIKDGADKEAEDDEGKTALIIAAERGHIDALRALLDNGADVNARTYDGGLTALILMLQKDDTEIAKMLLEEYNASIEPSFDNLTPLMCAAYNGNIAFMELLIARGADLNDISDAGETALSSAVEGGQIETTQLLVTHGVAIHNDNDMYENSNNNLSITNILKTGRIIDKIKNEIELTEEDKEFMDSSQYSREVAAQRLQHFALDNEMLEPEGYQADTNEADDSSVSSLTLVADAQQRCDSLSSDDNNDEKEKDNEVIKAEAELDSETIPDTLLWINELPQWLEYLILNTSPIKTFIEYTNKLDSMYGIKSVQNLAIQTLSVEHNKDSVNDVEDNMYEKITIKYDTSSEEAIDRNITFNEVGIRGSVLPIPALGSAGDIAFGEGWFNEINNLTS